MQERFSPIPEKHEKEAIPQFIYHAAKNRVIKVHYWTPQISGTQGTGRAGKVAEGCDSNMDNMWSGNLFPGQKSFINRLTGKITPLGITQRTVVNYSLLDYGKPLYIIEVVERIFVFSV